jgi:biofilm PGA synthesis N-glycosyltransferase PgaC
MLATSDTKNGFFKRLVSRVRPAARPAAPADAAVAVPAAMTPPRGKSGLTVIVPAYNESASVADTIRSLQQQTVPPDEIVVVDDCSTDNTGDVARACGVTVIRPPTNTGSKAGAQNFALTQINTPFTMALDADTTLAPDGIEKLLEAFDDPKVGAACGFVIPRHVKSVWERGRYVEYLFAFGFYKRIQDYYEKPLICSGCFGVYRTDILRENGGWQRRTLAEDMDLTWSFYQAGHKVRFIQEACCYPIEPHDFHFMSKQLRRWSHGFVQNVRLHWKKILDIPFLRSTIAVAMWDATIASIVYLILLPLLALIFLNPYFLLGYLIDAPVVAMCVIVAAAKRKEVWKAIASIPSFFVLRTVNGYFMLEALWKELVLRKPLLTYEKGH